ncbi:MAG: transposase [Acidobacteriota bacterium]|nr:transposase [Acidobacteriota bacterium]
MPRPPRDTAAGVFHVYTHCVWGVPELFRDDADRLEFLRHLARVSTANRLTCVGFCLMRSHYHLIVQVEDDVLPIVMHALNLPYARAFNKRHSLRGHVQFDRYGARRIRDRDDLLDRYAYVANNPVEAGLRERAEDWQWSSFAGTVGLRAPHSFIDDALVLACFEWPLDARAELRRWVWQRGLRHIDAA